MQFDWFLSVLEQIGLENLDIYSIGAAELPLKFSNCTPLPKGDGDTSKQYILYYQIMYDWNLLVTCVRWILNNQ